MGHQSRLRQEKKKQQVIHRTKLFGGVSTAMEVHAKYAWRGKCGRCDNTPVIKVRLYMLHDDFISKYPLAATAIAASNEAGPYVPTFPTTFGPMVMTESYLACRSHQRELEVECAKAPSWVLVEIDRGPGADKPVSQVPQHA